MVDELTTLCGIDVCAILFSEFHSGPEVWPSPLEVQRIITKFKNYSEYEQGKKKLNQESYLMDRIMKSKEKLGKVQRTNWEMEKSLILFQCLVQENFINTLNTNVLNDLASEINEKLKEITSKMNQLDTNETT
ncbi:MADS-box transcription factor family protein [Medicago truncatula]|uniref:MADS-box transcription factor family protein n=2 Tax=Medicago truncatula TaxID=3880 RepID=A0A072UZC6_MEDTR|nr:MADS-box transcription factor family protein [Medicago truncatula]